MPDPVAAIANPDGLVQLLWRAAYARSTNINTDMVMVDTETAVMKVLRVGYNLTAGIVPRLIGGAWKEASFAMEAQTPGEKKILEDAEGFFRDSCTYLVRCASRGGQAFTDCLNEKQQQTLYALESVRYKAMESARINQEVIGELNRCIDFTHRVKVVSEATMVVLGAFVPLSWVTQTAIGAAYTLTCEIAKSVSQVQSSDLLGFAVETGHGAANAASKDNLASNGAGAACNVAQDVTGAWAARTSYLLSKLQAENIRLREMMDTRIRGYITQRGGDPASLNWMTNAQRARVDQGFQAIENNAAKIAAAQTPNAVAQAAKWGARGASIAVGLFFMREEIAKAWYGVTEYEEMQRHRQPAAAR